MATNGIFTTFPVGGTPGRIQSISLKFRQLIPQRRVRGVREGYNQFINNAIRSDRS